jgi:hypothetical protein
MVRLLWMFHLRKHLLSVSLHSIRAILMLLYRTRHLVRPLFGCCLLPQIHLPKWQSDMLTSLLLLSLAAIAGVAGLWGA